MLDNAQSSNRSPAWWQDDHEGGWQRVRSAMKRDWEQTKADLTAGRKGADLNQNVGDTVGQALGKQATPGPSTPNAMNAAELETHVRKAARSQDREAARWAKDAEKAIDKSQAEAGPYGRGWEQAEAPIRYGYGAASHYGIGWGDETESQLRAEWTGLNPAEPWEDVRIHVRRGWDEARR